MSQIAITNGPKMVLIIFQDGTFSARLYVNNGETATLQSWKGKTDSGARKWASKVMV